MDKYSFSIGWSEEDQEYVATCPSFPGLSALGATEEEALAEAKIALGLFIETCKEKNIPLPEPQHVDSYSGQFRVRLPKSLHRQASERAALDGESLNQFVVRAVESRVGSRETGTRMLAEMKQALREHHGQLTVGMASAISSASERMTVREVETKTSLTLTKTMVSGRQTERDN